MGSSPTTGTILKMSDNTSYSIKDIPFIPISITEEGALRRAAERCRQGHCYMEKETGAFVIPLTTLEFVALGCPNGQVIRITPEALSIFDKPTYRDLAANCWDGS